MDGDRKGGGTVTFSLETCRDTKDFQFSWISGDYRLICGGMENGDFSSVLLLLSLL